MAAGRRLLSAVLIGLVTLGLPGTAAAHDGFTGITVEPVQVSPGGVVVIRGHQVATDDQVTVALVGPVERIELATAVTDGEGHFTVGGAIPPQTAVGRYTIEVTGLSGVHMSVDLLIEGTPIYDAQNGAPPGRDEGLPARPSVERRILEQGASQTLAAPAPEIDLVPLAALGLAVGGFVLFMRWSRRPTRPRIGSTDLP